VNNVEKLQKIAGFYEDEVLPMLQTAWEKGNRNLCTGPHGEIRDSFVANEERVHPIRIKNKIPRKKRLLEYALESLTVPPTRSRCIHA